MKRLPVIAAACLFAASPGFAADEHDHSKDAAKPSSSMMHEHMKLMREQMAQIRAAKDPKERERLMNEHMKTMEDSMGKMRGMMDCGKM